MGATFSLGLKHKTNFIGGQKVKISLFSEELTDPSSLGLLFRLRRRGNGRSRALNNRLSLLVRNILKVNLGVPLVGWLCGDTVVSVFPRNDLITPVSNLVAEGLHWKDCEWFFHLSGKFLNTEKENRNDNCGRQHAGVVPGSLERLVERERHKKKPEGQETGYMAIVK